MNELEKIEEMATTYAPMAIEKLESVAYLTGVSNIIEGFISLVISIFLVVAMIKCWKYADKNRDDIGWLEPPWVAFYIVTSIFLIVSVIGVMCRLLHPWNYIAMFDGSAWAIHELIRSLKYK